MPQTNNFTFQNQIVGGNIGIVQSTGTLNIKDVEVRETGESIFKGAPINIHSKTIIENGSKLTIQSP